MADEEEFKRLKETVENLKDIVQQLQAGNEEKEESLKNELTELRSRVSKLVVSKESGTGISTGLKIPSTVIAPAQGMTPEQQAEVKKIGLQVNALFQKLKDAETKLSDAAAAIRKAEIRTAELEEKEEETTKDIYSNIDTLNNTISEKIAQQRVEVQRLAGDDPKPINYDPFNYGEAYGGDLVDFQARKRIIEIKLLLQGLQVTMNQMKDSLKITSKIDLGYKVIRMDQLLEESRFAQDVKEGKLDDNAALLISQSDSREPGKVHYPRMEAFKIDEKHTSQWAITDSIMQTMYRMESELGELQKTIRTLDMASNSNALEDIMATLKRLKDTKVDNETVHRMISETLEQLPKLLKEERPKTEQAVTETSLTTSMMLESLQNALRHMSSSIEFILKRLNTLEENADDRGTSAASKGIEKKTKNCLVCDRNVDGGTRRGSLSIPAPSKFSDRINPRRWINPPKLRHLLDRNFKISVNGEATHVYAMPRPVGASYAEKWPMTWNQNVENYEFSYTKPPPMPCVDNFYIVGNDGRIYLGDKSKYKGPMIPTKTNVPPKTDRVNKGVDRPIYEKAELNTKGNQ